MREITFVWDNHQLRPEIVEFGPRLDFCHVTEGPRHRGGYRRHYMARHYPRVLAEEDQREADEAEEAYVRWAETAVPPGLPYPVAQYLREGRTPWERRCRRRYLRELDASGSIRLVVHRLSSGHGPNSPWGEAGGYSGWARMLWVERP